MTDFIEFRDKVNEQFKKMQQQQLFEVHVDKDELWRIYLDSFPPGTNELYRERTQHDCQCCRQFINNLGAVVTINNDQLETIWDIEIDSFYQTVASALNAYIKNVPLKSVYATEFCDIGTKQNYEQKEGQEVKAWDHFYAVVPEQYKVSNKEGKQNSIKETKEVFKRSLNEISMQAVDTVIELINENQLYRGDEHLHTVKHFKQTKEKYESIKRKDYFVWQLVTVTAESILRIRNTVIGTLLVDLSENVPLERAVASFESKVAPTNYKRPTAVISQTMVKKAKEKINELGYTDALERRFAVSEDVSVNNVIYANRSTKSHMKDVFDEMLDEIPVVFKAPTKTESITIERFLKEIVPASTSVELYVENKFENNFVSLVAPVNANAKGMFKWDNNFSWSYNGNLADSIKERVKKAGGDVTGFLRCSLAWFNKDDLDIHLVEPNGNRIYFYSKRSRTGGRLDVDMNATSPLTSNPVENITYPNSNIPEGCYKLIINQYRKRAAADYGFEVEIELDSKIYSFKYTKSLANKEDIIVAEFKYSKVNGIEFFSGSLPRQESTKKIWNINTMQYVPVSMIMLSPNHWNGLSTGNKHYFFILEDCINPEPARGFYNEFLNDKLSEHRKVFEVLGSKMKTEVTNQQLSGIGASSTVRQTLQFKVKNENVNMQRIYSVMI